MYNYWYQFDNFNSYISNIASKYNSDWKYPLYFGNMYKGNEHYETFKTHAKGLTNINNYDDNYYYAVNNSNGMKWGDGNYDQVPLQGLMYNRLDSKGNLQVQMVSRLLTLMLRHFQPLHIMIKELPMFISNY